MNTGQNRQSLPDHSCMNNSTRKFPYFQGACLSFLYIFLQSGTSSRSHASRSREWSGSIESGVICYWSVRFFPDAHRHLAIRGLREEGVSPTWQSHRQRDCFVATLLAMTVLSLQFNLRHTAYPGSRHKRRLKDSILELLCDSGLVIQKLLL